MYDRLFNNDAPDALGDKFLEALNPDSLHVLENCMMEPSLADGKSGDTFQFERLGYFCVDKDSKPGTPIYNRTATLRDGWAKIQNKGK